MYPRSEQEIMEITEVVYQKLEQFIKSGLAEVTQNSKKSIREFIEQEMRGAIVRIQDAAEKTPIDRVARLQEMRELAMLLYHIGQKEEAQAVAAKIKEALGI